MAIHAKLLEIYAKRRDVKAFEMVAAEPRLSATAVQTVGAITRVFRAAGFTDIATVHAPSFLLTARRE